MSAAKKKIFYNRVRRTCLKHGIDIIYDGSPGAIFGVQLVKDGSVMFADNSSTNRPLNIDWESMHKKITEDGYKGGVK